MAEINLSPYTPEYEAIQRRRKMAELLQAQANQPLETNQMAGGYVVPVSPFAGLAKVLQGYTSGQIERDSTEKMRQLSERKRSDTTADMGALVAALTGSNEMAKPAIQMPPEEQGGGPGRDAIPATGMMNPSFIQSMKTPEMQQMALQLIGQQAAPKGINIVPEGGTAIQGSKVLYKSPRREEFSTTPHYETDPATGQVVAVYANKAGGEDRRVPANPRDQFNTTSADSSARLKQAEDHFNRLSAEQQASLRLRAQQTGVSIAELMFNTGAAPAPVAVPGLPQAPQAAPPQPQPALAPPVPQGSPQDALARALARDKAGLPANEASLPQAAPQPLLPTAPPTAGGGGGLPPPIPGLSPTPGTENLPGKYKAQIATDAAKVQAEAEAKRAFNMGGLGDVITAARNVLTGKTKPTESGFGAGVDYMGALVGISPKGAPEADQLASIGGALVSKMPRMEGPQSDRDVALYQEMAGRVGNRGLPIERRLAALESIESLWNKYDKTARTIRPTSPQAASGQIRFLGFEQGR